MRGCTSQGMKSEDEAAGSGAFVLYCMVCHPSNFGVGVQRSNLEVESYSEGGTLGT